MEIDQPGGEPTQSPSGWVERCWRLTKPSARAKGEEEFLVVSGLVTSQCPIVPAWRSDRIKSELVYSTYLRIYYPILSPPHNPQLSVNKECVRDDECVDCTIHALESAAKGCCGNQIRWEHESEQLPR